MELKICLIISNKINPEFINKFVTWVENQDNFVIDSVTIINKTDCSVNEHKYLSGLLTRAFYRFISWMEARLLVRSDRYRDFIHKSNILSCHPLLNFVEVSSAPDFIKLNSKNAPHLIANDIDAIINFTNFKISDDIIGQSKFGLIRLSDANWSMISSHQWKTTFWAVYMKNKHTRFEILLDQVGCIKPIVNGFIKTQLFFSLNRAALIEKEISYIKIILQKWSEGESFIRINDNSKFAEFEGTPVFFTFVRYVLQIISIFIGKFIKSLLGIGNRWGVAFAMGNWENLDLSSGSKLDIRPGHYIADPFVISKAGKTYCFVEEYSYKEHKGWISVYELNGVTNEYIGIALKEDFHLSFPYLFDFEGITYMCPETSNKSEIRVYQCDEFPIKWSIKNTIMKDVNAADTMLFEKSGKWWMFTNIDPVIGGDNCSELSIFYADSPLSTIWKAHEKNPVLIDSNRSRNGGLLRTGKSIFRVGQGQDYDIYGKRTSINEIIILDEKNYEERCLGNIEPFFFENISGTHHLYSNNEITVYDFVSSRNKWT